MSESLTVTSPVVPFSAAEMAMASAGGERVIDALAKLEADPAVRVDRLGRTLGLASMGHGRLMALEPDFGAIPFEMAVSRECVALRGEDGGLVVAIADPFDADLLDGLGARLREPYELVLADHDDLAACLARHEDEVRRAAGLIASHFT